MPNPNPHPEQFQDGVRWFQSLLLLAPLFGTSLRVPYPLVVGAQLCASLLSMHIFVHASRFEAYDGMGDDTTDATFAPLFYGNASSQQLSLYKPSTSSSMRVTLCAAATSAAKYAPPKLRWPHRPCLLTVLSRASCARYQLAPPGLSLTLAAFFKRTQVRMYPQRLFLPASLPSLTLILASHRRLLKRSQLSGFIELDKLSRQLSAGRGIGGR